MKEILKIDNISKIYQAKNGEVVALKEKHDSTIANNIMRLVQENFEEKMYITVTFKKS